jgi:hypothetical protein
VINIIGDNASVRFDRDSKEYINSTIESKIRKTVTGRISWLNINSGSGGIFVDEIGRVIPFSFGKNMSLDTMKVIIDSLGSYALQVSTSIAAEVIPLTAADGRVKRYILS